MEDCKALKDSYQQICNSVFWQYLEAELEAMQRQRTQRLIQAKSWEEFLKLKAGYDALGDLQGRINRIKATKYMD